MCLFILLDGVQAISTKDLIFIWIAIAGIIVTVVLNMLAHSKRHGSIDEGLKDWNDNKKTLKEDMKEGFHELRADIKGLIRSVGTLEGRIARNEVTKSNSPRTLNPAGKKLVAASGIDKIVKERKEFIIEYVRSHEPTNAYQAQQLVIDYVATLSDSKELKDKLETGAFNSGYDVPTVLYAGAIYIRDEILEHLKYDLAAIDEHDPDQGNDPK